MFIDFHLLQSQYMPKEANRTFKNKALFVPNSKSFFRKIYGPDSLLAGMLLHAVKQNKPSV